MNPNLLIEIAELALSAAKAAASKHAAQDMDVEHTLLEIAQRTAYAYREHTGEPLDPSLIRIEEM